MSTIVLTVILINITEFHFRIIAQWSILQNIMNRTVDIVLSSRVILQTSYFISYILLSTSQFFLQTSL